MNSYLDSLPIGSDPRVFKQFLDIKEELDKRFHPARPDINWQHVHELCISLFNQNGVDLQTAAWFTLCHQQQAGLTGLNEGLSLINRILTQYWQTLWPVQTHTRMNILSVLNQQLITNIRGTTFVYADLAQLYQAEEILKSINNHLQTLEIKHLVQFDYLQNLIVTHARQLENTDTLDNNFYPPNLSTIINKNITSSTKKNDHSLSNNLKNSPIPNISYSSTQSQKNNKDSQQLWKGMLIGILASSLIFIVIFYFWLYELKNDTLTTPLAYIPSLDAHASAVIEKTTTNGKEAIQPLNSEQIDIIQQSLDTLATLSPIWPQTYGLEVIDHLNEQYNDSPELLDITLRWKNYLQLNASTDSQLNQWASGMAQLDALSQRLDSFDGNPKKYITGSELKSIIFKARQHFNQAKPLEEELRLLEKQPTQNPITDYQYQQIDNHFKQLLNRYALLRSK